MVKMNPTDWNTLSEHSQDLFILGLIEAVKNLEEKVEVLQCELNQHRNTLHNVAHHI